MPGIIIRNVGSLGLALSLWVFGAVIAWFGLAIDLEYGCMLPRSGGSKVYLEYTYRRPRFLASTVVAIFAVVFGITASNCIIFAKYVLFALQIEPTDFMTKLLAVGTHDSNYSHPFLLPSNGYTDTERSWLDQSCLDHLHVSHRDLTSCLTRSEEVKLTTGHSNFEDLWADTNWDFNTISTAFFKVLYSYAGLGNINNVLNEVKNPVRTLKTVAPIALLTACVLYLAINLAFVSVIPLDEVKRSNELIAALFFEKLGYGRWYLPLLIALSAAGNVMVVTFSLVSPISTTVTTTLNPIY